MRLSLDGADWQFKDYYGEDWRWRDAHQPQTRDLRFWRRGTVPGSVHHDLWALGEIPDPYWERNSLLLEWIPARTWLYRRTFQIDAGLEGRRIQLCFEGVDYAAEFFLNGDSLGSHAGMFTPARFEVGDRLRYGGENTLAVVLEPSPQEQPQVSRTSKVRTHKSRMTYWWDFCPRMIHIGIWDSVYLHVTGPVRMADVFVRPRLAPDHSQAAVAISTTVDAAGAQEIALDVTLRLNGQAVARARSTHALPAGSTTLRSDCVIETPALWWPNGHGAQPLYEADVCVLPVESAAAGAEHDRRIVSFGVRSIEFIPNEGADTAARPYTLVVNGRRMYIKGWNWVPLDVLYGVERPDKLERLLTLARDAHVNMLRVWGGGLIEREDFYARCDRLGLLIWQEFIQSSSGIENTPSDDPDFVRMLVGEAEQIIPRRRNHPALAVWGGGNELSAGPDDPLDEAHPLLAALKEAVTRLDPDRYWLPTSPTGRVFLNSLENIARDPAGLHDVHGPWEYQGVRGQYELYNRSTSLLHSEFGVEGVTNLRALRATIGPEHLWPATLDNPVWHHRGAWWNQHPMWQATFGPIGDPETLVRATQFMQAAGLRYAVEADRRRKYHNSGTLPWQFNEPYPNATCTAAVDYFGQPKPVYYAVAHAYEPVHVSARFAMAAWAGEEDFEAEIWASNSRAAAIPGALLTARIVGAGGRIYATWTAEAHIPGDGAAGLLAVRLPLAEVTEPVFFLDMRLHAAGGSLLSGNRYAFTTAQNLAPLLAIPPTRVTHQRQSDGDVWRIAVTSTGAQVAAGLWLEDARPAGSPGAVMLDANYIFLLPGESARITARWHAVPVEERRLSLGAWNTREVVIS